MWFFTCSSTQTALTHKHVCMCVRKWVGVCAFTKHAQTEMCKPCGSNSPVCIVRLESWMTEQTWEAWRNYQHWEGVSSLRSERDKRRQKTAESDTHIRMKHVFQNREIYHTMMFQTWYVVVAQQQRWRIIEYFNSSIVNYTFENLLLWYICVTAVVTHHFANSDFTLKYQEYLILSHTSLCHCYPFCPSILPFPLFLISFRFKLDTR